MDPERFESAWRRFSCLPKSMEWYLSRKSLAVGASPWVSPLVELFQRLCASLACIGRSDHRAWPYEKIVLACGRLSKMLYVMRVIIRSQAVRLLLALSLLAVTGLGAGLLAGRSLITGYLKSGNPLAFMFYRPSFYYIEALQFLNSPIEMRRAAGYYALLDSGRIDLPYLLERYGKEDSPYIKRIIVWLMGFSHRQRKAVDALSEIYRDAPATVRMEILRSVSRIDTHSLDDFIKIHGVDRSVLDRL